MGLAPKRKPLLRVGLRRSRVERIEEDASREGGVGSVRHHRIDPAHAELLPRGPRGAAHALTDVALHRRPQKGCSWS